jgi:hypothetical protein
LSRRAALGLAAVALVACGGDLRRFPLREPLARDTDTQSVRVPCRADPEERGHSLCTPEPYESPFAWDAADNTLFRPLARLFAVDPGGEAANVNALDEVPDSSWFENRIGARAMTPDELVSGPCGAKVLDPSGPDGSWLIDQGKPNGANPGFRVKVPGVGKFMLKADPPDQPERATGATSIAARLYHAAGFYVPCDSVVYFRPSILKLKPGLVSADNSGVQRPFDQAALDRVLTNASRRGELVRMVASRWLPGRPIGPFKYEGTREDDPNDVIPHEDRRELRGGRVLAAWLNHFDSREQNTLSTWLADDEADPDSSPGHVRHYYIDLGDCFGSEWEWEEISKRLGHSYYLDLAHVGADLVTLGIPERPWDRAARREDARIFGFFSARDFEPDAWRGGYPNPAFSRLTERDAAWMTRILARLGPEHVEAAVRAGDYTDPRHTEFLKSTLLARQRAIFARYFSVLSPITDVRVSPAGELCSVDLARRTATFPASRFRYEAFVYAGHDLAPRGAGSVRPSDDGGVCLSLSHVADDGGEPEGSPGRYVVVDVTNGVAEGPLRAHLYDLGPRGGFRLVGVERPESASPPR